MNQGTNAVIIVRFMIKAKNLHKKSSNQESKIGHITRKYVYTHI